MSNLQRLHQEYNESTREDWERFESHRIATTRLAIQAGHQLVGRGEPKSTPSLSLAVMGAGNGNDLDLRPLLSIYESIDLIDLDTGALQRNELRCQEHGIPRERVRFLSADVTSIVPRLERLGGGDSISADLIAQALEPSIAFTDRKYDVVLSSCLLSQLIHSVTESVASKEEQMLPLLFAVRDGHLGLIMSLMNPKACGVLITDFMSSFTVPALSMELEHESFRRLVKESLEQKNFFTGTNPWAIAHQLRTTMSNIQKIHVTEPWRWQLADRVHGVAAICFVVDRLE